MLMDEDPGEKPGMLSLPPGFAAIARKRLGPNACPEVVGPDAAIIAFARVNRTYGKIAESTTSAIDVRWWHFEFEMRL
jgi:hypothetical protein